ncbi:MAG TPA: hypothetical protein VFT59_00450 [Candidatus Saccharimonadales bacterium]|nr:hypothetical protein [Candidatus Saccharimonadales bacterium]
MDIQPTNQQPISDDQELAKVLAGVSQQADNAAAPADDMPVAPTPPSEPVAPPPMPEPTAPAPSMPSLSGTGDLDTIKKDALSELRPLVDKLNVSPEEKFDTYLLLIRSTDDQSLIAPAHEAARAISDEARRAQALLDIIKEIDYLSNPQQPAA